MKEPKHWIKVNSADVGHEEMLDNFEEVLTNFNINCYNDEELAQQHQCDLFIVLEKTENNKNTFNEKEYWENRTEAYLKETESLKKGKK
tara:strand:- start:56 stop:322 length:267 start_codon:yes stop_codon:yes gene_type:complete